MAELNKAEGQELTDRIHELIDQVCSQDKMPAD